MSKSNRSGALDSKSNRSSLRSRLHDRSQSPAAVLRLPEPFLPANRSPISSSPHLLSRPPPVRGLNSGSSSGSNSPPRSYRDSSDRNHGVSTLADLSETPAHRQGGARYPGIGEDLSNSDFTFGNSDRDRSNITHIVSSPPLHALYSSAPGARPPSATRRIASSSLPGEARSAHHHHRHQQYYQTGQPGEITPGRAPQSQSSAFRNKDFNVTSVQSIYPMRNPNVNRRTPRHTPVPSHRPTPPRSPRKSPSKSPRRIDDQHERDPVMLSSDDDSDDGEASRRLQQSLQSSLRFNDDPFDIQYTRMASGHGGMTSDSDAELSSAPLIRRDESRMVCVSRTHSETRDLRDISRIFEKTKSEKFADATPGVLVEMFLRRKRIIKKPHLFIVTMFFILYIMALSNRSADAELTAPVTKRFQDALFAPADSIFGNIFGDDSPWNEQRQRWQNRPPTFIDPVTGLLTLTDAARQAELLERLCRGNFVDKGMAGSRFGRHLYCELVELKWQSDIDGCQYHDEGYIQNVTLGWKKF